MIIHNIKHPTLTPTCSRAKDLPIIHKPNQIHFSLGNCPHMVQYRIRASALILSPILVVVVVAAIESLNRLRFYLR